MHLLIAILLTSLLAVSCGGKQVSTANLKVTDSMMLSNDGFTGGLIIQGFGPNNHIFNKFIPYTSGAVAEMRIQLIKGSWTFKAIGWTGSTKYSGTVKCASTSINLDASNSAIDLEANVENCTNDFGATTYSTAPGNYKNLKIVTCSQLHRADGDIVSSDMDETFCNLSSSLPASAKTWAKSARVSTFNKMPEGTWEPDLANSVCLTGPEGILSGNLNIPTKAVPLEITLFDSTNCLGPEKRLVSYHFHRGLEHNYLTETVSNLKQDKVLTTSSTNQLFLSTSDIRRGISSFYDLLPEIKCGSGSIPCFDHTKIQLPTTPIVANFVGYSGMSYLLENEVTATRNCSTLEWDTTNPNFDASQTRCYEREEGKRDQKKLIVDLGFNQDNCSTGCGLQYRFGNTGSWITLNVITPNSHSLNSILHQLIYSLGYSSNNPTPPLNGVNQIFYSLNSPEDQYGNLSRVREMLHPDGPAGLLGTLTCSPSVNKSETITFFEEGKTKTYLVEVKGRDVTGISEDIPRFICQDGSSNPAVCPTAPNNYYDAVMKLKKRDGVQWITESIMKFRCDRKLGQLERHENEDGEVDKELIFWNTQDPDVARLESYSLEIERSADVIQNVRTEFERVEKVNTEDIRIQSFRFESHLSNGEYNQRAERRETSINNVINKAGSVRVESRYNGSQAEGAVTLFDDGANKSESANSILNHVYTSPNGKYHLEVKYDNMSSILLKYLLPVEQSHGPISLTTPFDDVKADVNNSGFAVVCWTEGSPGSTLAYSKVYDGSTWSDFSVTTPYVDKVDCRISETGRVYVISHQTADPTKLTFQVGDITGVPVDLEVSVVNYIDHVIELLSDNESLHIAIVKGSSSFSLEYGQIALISGAVSYSPTDTPNVMSAAATLNHLEFTDNHISSPKVSLSWIDLSDSYLDVYSFENSPGNKIKAFNSVVGNIPSASQDNEMFCFDTSSNIDLMVLDDMGSCPTSMQRSAAPPVKSQFKFDLKSMDPDNFKNMFTPSSQFN